MHRQLSSFKGDALLIAGGWCKDHTNAKPAIRSPDNFYTIDRENAAEPDAVLDITDASQFTDFPDGRFNFIFFEHLSYLGEATSLKAFSIAHRLLRQDGVVIYRGGSDITESSIPDILKQAGFRCAFKKEIHPDDTRYKTDNGTISVAAKCDATLLIDNFNMLPDITQHYLKSYKFNLPDEPCDTRPFNHRIKTHVAMFPAPIDITISAFRQMSLTPSVRHEEYQDLGQSSLLK